MPIISPGYNVSGGVSAGFVRNDGSGDLIFGEPGTGGVGTGWELVEKKVIGSDTTSITFSGLDGDTDEQYMFIMHENPLTSAGASYQITIRPNGATTLQQTQSMAIPSSTGNILHSNFTDLRWRISYQRALELVVDTTLWFHAKSGNVRLLHCTSGAGGGIQNPFPSGLGIEISTGQWDDQNANVTFIDIVANTAGGLGAGSIYWLYKKSSLTGGGGLELIETKIVGSPTGSLTFSGLNGDVDKCYKLIWSVTAPSSGGSPQYFIIQPNGQVAGAAGSVHDTLFINDNSVGVARFQFPELRFATIGLSPRVIGGELTFFAETGRTRTYMSLLNSTSTAAAAATRTGNQHWHGSWDDGAGDTINITSLVLNNLAGNSVAYTVGSRFSLYRVTG